MRRSGRDAAPADRVAAAVATGLFRSRDEYHCSLPEAQQLLLFGDMGR